MATAWEVGFPSIGVVGHRLAGSPKGTAFPRPNPAQVGWPSVNARRLILTDASSVGKSDHG